MSAERRFEWTEGVTSDLAFVARGSSLEEVFAASADALLAATLDEPDGLEARVVTEDGELIRELTIDPSRSYQGLGRR